MANSRVCSIQDCGKRHQAKGFCESHYRRFKKYGDPLGGKTADGEPIRFIGDVALKHATGECLDWPYSKTKYGYGHLRVGDRKTVAHRYVCELAHGEPATPGLDAAHNCGNASCVNPGHIEWKTHVDNCADRLIHDTHTRGERNSQSKLTEAQAREILRLKGIKSQKKIAAEFGISDVAVGHIHHGRNWAWLNQ